MTDTTSAAPSDAEIDAQWRESVAKHETTAAFVRDFARAVLAKWGQPAPGEQNESAYQRGYMDGMAKVRRDVEAAPQQEAQEPVAWQSRTRPTWGVNTRPWSPWEPCTKEQAEDCWKTPLLHDWAYEARALFTAPQPAPAPLSDDTERLEWLLWKLPGDALRYVVGELADTSSGSEFRAAIDAALAAQGGN